MPKLPHRTIDRKSESIASTWFEGITREVAEADRAGDEPRVNRLLELKILIVRTYHTTGELPIGRAEAPHIAEQHGDVQQRGGPNDGLS
jgi:hypothetical protein